MDERRVTLTFGLGELQDIAKALQHRIDALADARTHRGHALRPAVRDAANRVVDLAAYIDFHIKQLEKIPGGAK